jgi:2-polyprenyl-6-methoxyphenol hydroxylase-like FAD-dependent oxidoreductase
VTNSIRARLVVERAAIHGWISPTLPVAILGAGIAGIGAAILARRNGAPVTIFEQEKPAGKPFIPVGGSHNLRLAASTVGRR